MRHDIRVLLGLLVVSAGLSGCATEPASQMTGTPVAAPAAAQEGAEEVVQVADLTLVPIVLNLRPLPTLSDDVLCSEQVVTGTHRSREICRTRAQSDAQRRQAQEYLRSGGVSGGGVVVGGRR